MKYPITSLVLTVLAGCIPLDGGSSVSQTVAVSEGAYICTPDDEAHIMIPPGALADDTNITIDRLSDHVPLGGLERVGAAWDFGPDGTQFRERVWIMLHPTLPAGVSIRDLSLFHESNGVVEELEDIGYNEADGAISGFTDHFSVFYAAYSGPAGGRIINVGGRNLQPYFGGSSTSVNPTEVPIWVAPGGLVSTNPYSGDESDLLVLQVNTDPVLANTQFFVEGWTISPVDPNGPIGPTGDRISTSGFWHIFFADHFLNPLRTLRTDAEGRLTLVIRGVDLYRDMLNAPPGYSSGRFRLRVFAPEGPEAVDIILALGLLQ